MDWEDAMDDAREQMGYSKTGYISPENFEEVCDTARAILSSETRQTYKNYLQSEEWKRKRILVLERDKYQCQICSAENILDKCKNLFKGFEEFGLNNIPEISASEVHHLTYTTLHTPQEIQDCVSLCSTCHKFIHERFSMGRRSLEKQREENAIFRIYYHLINSNNAITNINRQKWDFIKSLTIKPTKI